MASKPKFERYGGNKVRTGCVTCKARRVKCDEAKPTCTRCSKAGRLCGGYAPTPPKDRNEAGQPFVIISYVALESPISLLPGVGSREKRSLDFFRTRTVPETFPFADWSEHVLRTSCYEDAIRHAIVALGALHEHYQGMSQIDSSFAMLEYSKAMKQVMKLDMKGSASTDVALISCILFACFESLQGHYRSSLLHVNSGLQILKEQELSNVADTKVAYVSKDVLRPMFLRFVTQSREIGDPDILLAYDTLPTIPRTPMSAFNSFEEARCSMNVYVHDFILFLKSLDPGPPRNLPRLQAIAEQHIVLTKRHTAWGKAFDDLLERGPTATESDIAKLQVWRTLIDAMLELNVARGGMAWDAETWDGKTDMFRKLVNFAEIVVEKQPRGQVVSSGTRTTTTQVSGSRMSRLNSKDQHQDPMDCDDAALSLSQVNYCQTVSLWKPVFSLDIGIVTPLYVVVSRCRDPAIRRRGLQLLASCNRREGIWDSTLAARVGERIIAIEENGATSHPVLYASQIPEHARIRDLHTKFGVDRQGLIQYTKNVACDGPDNKWEELLEW